MAKTGLRAQRFEVSAVRQQSLGHGLPGGTRSMGNGEQVGWGVSLVMEGGAYEYGVLGRWTSIEYAIM
ncbi:hypothetical protein Dda_7579 [Drechslerella dactyloides]|uniref:Uncharacterized protein n=1 Tax=Drechslerella dactyloides TaxID=74499 RepID=A0AAD6IUA8_DREDA|nr:hypothetical protein Dda_7579 [Drechslerella dactyloides]